MAILSVQLTCHFAKGCGVALANYNGGPTIVQHVGVVGPKPYPHHSKYSKDIETTTIAVQAYLTTSSLIAKQMVSSEKP